MFKRGSAIRMTVFLCFALVLPLLASPTSSFGDETDGLCKQGDENCVTFYVSPAQNCPQGSFTDNMTVYFKQVVDGKVTSKAATQAGGSPTPKLVSLKEGTIWQLEDENDFFKQPYPCRIKVTSTNWEFADNCSAANPDGLEYCLGCSRLNAPDATTKYNGQTYSMLNPGCVYGDASVLNTNRVYLLDQQNGNYLFRGPRPSVFNATGKNWSFDYQDYIYALKDRFQRQMPTNSTFPNKFNLIDISLISDATATDPGKSEHLVLMSEYTFLGGNQSDVPSQKLQPAHPIAASGGNATGQFLWWQMLSEDAGGANASTLSD